LRERLLKVFQRESRVNCNHLIQQWRTHYVGPLSHQVRFEPYFVPCMFDNEPHDEHVSLSGVRWE